MTPHGTVARYTHRADPCRCGDCRTAMTTYCAERRAKRKAGIVPPKDHGLRWACGCDDCKCAKAEYHMKRTAKWKAAPEPVELDDADVRFIPRSWLIATEYPELVR